MLESDARITYVQASENLGFGRANNLGLEHASGKYLFLLNSDTLLMNDAIGLFFKKMETLPESVACLGTVLFNDVTCTVTGHSYCKLFGGFEQIYIYGLHSILKKLGLDKRKKFFDYKTGDEEFFEVESLIGADIFMRKSVAEKCGLFDPDFFLFREETEMFYRFRKRGFKTFIYRKPKIVHFGGMSSGGKGQDIPAWKLEHMIRAHVLYVQKTHEARLYVLAYKLTYFPFMCAYLQLLCNYGFKERLACFKTLLKAMRL